MLAAALLACAAGIAPVTLEAVIAAESGGRAVAINVNRNGSRDFGLMQVNEAHLAAFGVTPAQVMDPCTNLRIGAFILRADYMAASRIYGEGPRALMAALSAYNTGTFDRGFANGYVAKVYGKAVAMPAIPTIRLNPNEASPIVEWTVEDPDPY